MEHPIAWGAVWRELLAPDDFAQDWYGWITNEAAHSIVGVTVFGLAAWLCFRSRVAALAAVAVAYAAWEMAQLWAGGGFLDGLTDFAFVLAGCVFAKSAWEGRRRSMAVALAGIVLAGAIGVWDRL